MTVVPNIDRREAQRYEAAFKVRIAINGGPAFSTETLNFTSRSIAIRSDVEARKGDEVVIHVGDLPALKGDVARVFPEGFAVVLTAGSLDMMRVRQSANVAESKDGCALTTSPVFPVSSDRPARAQLTTAADNRPGYNRHFLTLLIAGETALDGVSNFWLTADGARWMTQAVKVERRGKHCAAYLILNDWQIRIGAAVGLEISIASGEMSDLRLSIDAAPIADHLAACEPFKLAVGA